MVAHPGPPALRQAEGALQLGAAGQQRRRLAAAGPAPRARSRASGGSSAAAPLRWRAPPSRRCACGSAGRGRGTGPRSRPAARGRRRRVGDRLVGDVGAGHHQRLAHVGQQQVVQRRVGQHHAEVRRAGRDRSGHRARPAGGGRSRSAARGSASSSSSASESSTSARAASIRRHQRERLVLAVLARPQGGHGLLVRRQAGQVVAAEALDGDDPPRRAAASTRLARSRCEQRRPAVGAGVRLGVEAAVGRVVVLGLAGRAHPKPAIVVERPVVGDAADDREARAAVGAVDERVAVAAVGGVEQLGQAVGAGGRCRARPARRARRRAGLARISKPPLAGRARARVRDTRSTAASGGASRGRRSRNASTARGLALHLEQHAVLVVEHEARQPELARQPVHVGPEADALDDALHACARARGQGCEEAVAARRARSRRGGGRPRRRRARRACAGPRG